MLRTFANKLRRGAKPSGKGRRRVLPIVNRRFQFKIALYLMGSAVLVSGITTVMWQQVYSDVIESVSYLMAMCADLLNGKSLDDVVNIPSWGRFVALNSVLLVVELIFFGLIGLVVSHRISGPAFVMQRYLAEIQDGRLPTLRPLRKHDELAELYAALDKAVTTLVEQENAALTQLRECHAALVDKGVTDEAILAQLVARIDASKSRIG